MTSWTDDIGGGYHDRWDGAVVNDCPRCKQPAGVKCVNPQTGKPAHLPCIVRLKAVSA